MSYYPPFYWQSNIYSTYQAPAPQLPPASNDMLWVLGEAEAVAYPVAPGATVTLWDKNTPTIYVKSVDARGIPSMRVLDFAERNSTPPAPAPVTHECKCGEKFVQKEDFSKLVATVNELSEKITALESAKPARAKKASVEVENDG